MDVHHGLSTITKENWGYKLKCYRKTDRVGAVSRYVLKNSEGDLSTMLLHAEEYFEKEI